MNFWGRLPQPIVGLAPMDGVTDATFRRVVAAQGVPDVTFTEFTHVGDISRGPEFLLASLQYSEEERPIVGQIYGKDPHLFYVAAHVICELGFDGLDVNMGCPSKTVASSGSGAALIKTPDLAHEIVRAAKQGIKDWAGGQSLESVGLKPSRCEAIRRMNTERAGGMPVPRRPIPISVKTRLGCDSVVINRWVEHLLEEQPAAITIHGRTLAQMYRGDADWGAIAAAAAIARGSSTMIVGNGDIQSISDAVRRIQVSGVNGVLVGRATLGAPWFFRRKEIVRAAFSNGTVEERPLPESNDEEVIDQRLRVMLDHAGQFETLCGQEFFRRMRKHLGWYCKGFPHAAAMRARMFQACSLRDVKSAIAEYFGDDKLREVQTISFTPPSEIMDACV